MQNKYLSALKTKYASFGLSKEALDRVASQRVKTIANEDEIDSDIASSETMLLIMKEMQGLTDTQRNRATQIQKELDDLKKQTPQTQKTDDDNPYTKEISELKELVSGMAAKFAENEKRTREDSIRSAVEAKMKAMGCTNEYIRTSTIKGMEIGESDTTDTLVEKYKAEYDANCKLAFGEGYVPPKGSGGADDKPDYSAMVAGLKASGDLPK